MSSLRYYTQYIYVFASYLKKKTRPVLCRLTAIIGIFKNIFFLPPSFSCFLSVFLVERCFSVVHWQVLCGHVDIK